MFWCKKYLYNRTNTLCLVTTAVNAVCGYDSEISPVVGAKGRFLHALLLVFGYYFVFSAAASVLCLVFIGATSVCLVCYTFCCFVSVLSNFEELLSVCVTLCSYDM